MQQERTSLMWVVALETHQRGLVRRIVHESAQGGRHEQAIAERLSQNGIPSPAESTWGAAKVRGIPKDQRTPPNNGILPFNTFRRG